MSPSLRKDFELKRSQLSPAAFDVPATWAANQEHALSVRRLEQAR
jgi:hypothetical protein